jgi:hypothetical protein
MSRPHAPLCTPLPPTADRPADLAVPLTVADVAPRPVATAASTRRALRRLAAEYASESEPGAGSGSGSGPSGHQAVAANAEQASDGQPAPSEQLRRALQRVPALSLFELGPAARQVGRLSDGSLTAL